MCRSNPEINVLLMLGFVANKRCLLCHARSLVANPPAQFECELGNCNMQNCSIHSIMKQLTFFKAFLTKNIISNVPAGDALWAPSQISM